MPIDPSNAVLVHFYRAVVSHADVWRQRMDATTNWSAVTTAAVVTFALGDDTAPHFVVLLAIVFDINFLVMESRRYQVYDLWRRRFRTLNQYLIAPVLAPGAGPDAATVEEKLASVASDLGRTIPHLGIADAVGYRLRRNYGYLFAAILLAWLAKLHMHPSPASSLGELVARAAISTIPGWIVLIAVLALAVVAIVLAVRAPSERMINWTTVPSPVDRLLARSRDWIPGLSSLGEGDEPR
jgi:uncharacterized membrane protein